MRSIQAAQRIVRAITHLNTFDHVAIAGIDHLPIRTIDRWHVNRLAVRRDSHAIATLLVSAIPQSLFGLQIEAPELFRRAHVEAPGCGAPAEPFRLLARIRGRQPSYELVF